MSEIKEIEYREEYGIVEDYTKEMFEEHFEDMDVITFKNLTIQLNETGSNGKYFVASCKGEENTVKNMTKTPFKDRRAAVNYAVKSLVSYSKNRNIDGSEMKEEKKNSAKVPKIEGPRVIRVFGRNVYVETNPNATDEDIRIKLCTLYGFPNFKPGKVYFDYDASTGIVECMMKFNTKG